ncbi:pre-mrna-splicing factor rse1 [Phaffia rhodozyma]|uniref:Pre-mRNA-splicing factor RSE1 n=1 Tax=Phaffia rhodozyma TaxID=264483 RepID=A0A0F7SUP8_PHARH|nr:pre-mrna-splicing factor rse1 [Phaffia rhodozyma]
MALQPGPHFYNVTLSPPQVITHSVVGSFSGLPKTQEIIVARGTRIELLRPDPSTGKLDTVLESEVFGTVRSLAGFRLTGGTKDYVIVGSDSGRIVILEFIQTPQPHFKKLHQETFGKSGSRRIVPGQWLATDPKGRAVMIGAVEKAKLVYILNRDAAANLTISSPLEAHKQSAIILSIVGVDVGFDNPLFAALEVDYSDSDQDPTGEAFHNAEKMLTFYELDLGLNHVVRKWSEPTDPRANLLVQVPGGQSASTDRWEGPSGVLVCCEDYIIYRNMDAPQHRVPIPKRKNPLNGEDKGIIIVSAVMHKMKGDFFFLLQSEEGDLFKVTIEHKDEEVLNLKIKYFDTVPVASSLCILKSGFLFVASEFGNHYLHQFQKLGDDDDEAEFSSASYPEFGMSEDGLPSAYFRPRPLDNLALSDEVHSLDPIVDAKVANLLGQDTPQIFAACGKGSRSSFRMLRYGLEVSETVSSELPGVPNAVWTTKLRSDDEFDSYIILSFVNGTLVLSIGDTIEEVYDMGFRSDAPTLAVQQLGEDSLLQITPHEIRHVLASKEKKKWPVPPGTSIVAATTNSRQICVALNTGELVYFELDIVDGSLNEYQDKKQLPAGVVCMSMGEVPTGRQRSLFLAVGCENQTVHIISLDPENTLSTLSLQALTAIPSSICIAEMTDTSIDKNHPTMFLNIGLQNGVLLRTVIDTVNGQLTDTRQRFIGSKAARLVRVVVQGQSGVLALSSRSWLNYSHQNLLQFSPLIYENLDHAWTFSAELCPDGLIGIAGSTLRIFTIPKLGTKLKQDVTPLSYTPRRFVSHPSQKIFYVIESDHRAHGPAAIERMVKEKIASGSKVDMELVDLAPEVFGRPRADAGQWASCIRVVDPIESTTLSMLDLDENEAAFSIAVVPFASREGETLLVVGTAKDTFLSPRSCSSGYFRTYTLKDDGKALELLHITEVDDIPTCLMAFQGRLMAGVGKALRIYDIGKKKLLRKCENTSFPNSITTLNTQGSRIIVGDIQESVSYVTYKPQENRLIIFADDSQPRWVVSSTMVDYETVAIGDKFGNLIINRLPTSVTRSVDDDPTGAGILHEKSKLMGAPNKTTLLAHYNVGDIVTSVTRTSLVPGGRDVLLYTGLHGSIGLLIPFVSREDIEFMSTLEMHMRSEAPSLVGRDHLAYRGYYAPVKAVVDGDLCEAFALLPTTKQMQIAAELDRSTSEVLKKVESLRSSSGF